MPVQLSLKQLAFIGEAATRLPEDEVKSAHIEVSPNSLNMRVYTMDGRGTLVHMTAKEETQATMVQVRELAADRVARSAK